MSKDEKIKERTSLLMRMYWTDKIFIIGKELKITYFEKMDNWYGMNHYQGALQIASSIDDPQLQDILSKHKRAYGVNLGGFRGKIYTLDENGNLIFESSEEKIRDSVRNVLKKKSDKAYGVLQALINCGGKSSYYELIAEIENVLGYEFTPSTLLPRLSTMKLVFKTGSNRYPDWTMPSEIISTVQDELSKFIRPAKKEIPENSPEVEIVKSIREMESIVDKIVEARRNLDVVFKRRFGKRLLQQNEKSINDLRKPCSNEEEFNNRILNMALLVGGMEKKSLADEKSNNGTITMLENKLQREFDSFDKNILASLRMIITLRSKKHPVHKDDPKYLDALKYFGQIRLPPRLAESV